MKKTLKYNTAALGLLLAAATLVSCTKEEDFDITGDPGNKVYLNTETSYVNNYKFAIIHTPILSEGNIIVRFPVRCTKEAASEIKVTVGFDNSLVDTYNNSKATMYSKLQESQVTFTKATVTIPEGAMISSDSVIVSVPAENLTVLRDKGYLLPVKIKSVNDASGSEVSSNLNTVYIFITTSWTNCYSGQAIANMTGAIFTPRTGWKATLDVPLYSGNPGQLFDGSTFSYWQIRPPSKFQLTVDLAAEYDSIAGIRTNSNSTNYGMNQVNVYSSTDSLNWVYQGNPTLLTSSAYQYIRFYQAITARYLRIELVAARSTSRLYMAEFDFYHQLP